VSFVRSAQVLPAESKSHNTSYANVKPQNHANGIEENSRTQAYRYTEVGNRRRQRHSSQFAQLKRQDEEAKEEREPANVGHAPEETDNAARDEVP